MRTSGQSRVLAVVALAGLLSAVACHSHMFGETLPDHAHPAAHEADAGHSHHGAPEEGSTPEDPCCIVQVADGKKLEPAVLLPESVAAPPGMTSGMTVLRTADPQRPRTDEPPGRPSVLRQTSVLLI